MNPVPVDNFDPAPDASGSTGIVLVSQTLAAVERPAQTKLRRVAGVVAGFALGQGAVQGLQLLSAFFLVRMLSVEAYAQFGLAFAFQSTMGTLMDLGFASSIIPLVGKDAGNPAVIGRYVRAAKRFRDRAFWILAPAAAIAFFAIMHRHHWSAAVQITLIVSVLLALHAGGRVACYSPPLFISGRLRAYYLPQTVSALGRLAAYVALSFVGWLNSSFAAIVSAIQVAVNGIALGRSGRKHMTWPEHDDPKANREVFQYVLPSTPVIVLAAFQSQLSVFLISIFGSSPSIAEVAALSKLGQLFSVLMTFNVIVIEPYTARISHDRLLRNYLGLLLLTTILCVPVVVVAFAFPEAFLWLLGGSYTSLASSVGWIVLTACINHLSGLVWIMNRSRKWIFWSGTIIEVVFLLAVQIVFLVRVGVHTTQQAVFFSFVSSFCYVVAHGYVAFKGFHKDRVSPAVAG